MKYYVTSDPENGEPKKVFGPFDSARQMIFNAEAIAREHGGRIENHSAEIICDFCSSREVKWSYPAVDFVELSTAWGSTGEWAACDACHDCIENDDRKGLTQRSVDTFYVEHPGIIPDTKEARAAMFREISFLHNAFFVARQGAAHEEIRP